MGWGGAGGERGSEGLGRLGDEELPERSRNKEWKGEANVEMGGGACSFECKCRVRGAHDLFIEKLTDQRRCALQQRNLRCIPPTQHTRHPAPQCTRCLILCVHRGSNTLKGLKRYLMIFTNR